MLGVRLETAGAFLGWLNVLVYGIASGFVGVLSVFAYLPLLKPTVAKWPEFEEFLNNKKSIFHLIFLVFCFLKLASGIKLIIGSRTVRVSFNF